MSDTRNVKLGTCRIFYDGIDLGYTQGGVEVTVTTDTHEVNVDQFGKTVINETIVGRNVMAKVPMAETTLENLVRVMPGAKLLVNGAVQASETITVAALPAPGDTLTVAGEVFTFKASGGPLGGNDIAIGATVAVTASNIDAALSGYEHPVVAELNTTSAAAVVTCTVDRYGTFGNGLVTFAKTGAGLTLSNPATAGGVDGSYRVSVPTGVGVSLLDISKVLVLHPKELAAADHSYDFVIPRASTAGALSFTYATDKERLFPVSFKGYPDPVTDQLFFVGS